MSAFLTRRDFLGAAMTTGLAGCGARMPAKPIRLPARAVEVDAAGAFLAAKAPVQSGMPTPSDLFVADVHCHTFSARDLPIDGFIRSLAQGMGLPSFFDRALSAATRRFQCALVKATPPDFSVNEVSEAQDASCAGDEVTGVAAEVIEVLQKFQLGASGNALIAYINTLQNITKSRADIAVAIAETYPRVELFTPALVDFGYWVNLGKQAEVYDSYLHPAQQVEAHAQVSELSMRGQLAGCKAVFHPYVGFNPWRHVVERSAEDTKNQRFPIPRHVERAVMELGFVGVKIYPASGFLPLGNAHLRDFAAGNLGANLDASLRALYQWCVDQDIPILTHASMGNSFFKDSAWRGSPWAWRRVLDEFPKLRVCFGHFGHLEGINDSSQPLRCLAWAEGFIELLLKYDNVYADISDTDAAGTDAVKRTEYQNRFLYWLCGRLGDQESGVRIAQRLLYGSDWWMGMVTGMDRQFLTRIQEMVQVEMAPLTGRPSAEILARDVWGQNALRFLGIWANDGTPIKSGTSQRLRQRYDTVRKGVPAASRYPRWLPAV